MLQTLIINFVNKEFDLELDEDGKQDIKMSMIGGVGFGVAGILPGAIIGATSLWWVCGTIYW